MKVSYKFHDKKEFAKLEREYYTVLAYGYNTFLIANDELFIGNSDPLFFEIIDNDLSDYVNKKGLLYKDQELYIHKSLEPYLTDSDDYLRLTSREIWNRSKISNFFTQNEYTITESYKKTVLSTNYKINLIEGFLIFANDFINSKFINKSGSYNENLYFYVVENIEDLLNFKYSKISNIEKTSYQKDLQYFIEETLLDDYNNKKKSSIHCLKLFYLIDSIFLDDVSSIQLINNGAEEYFVIEYLKKFYILMKYSGS